jgi:hypothetical protein
MDDKIASEAHRAIRLLETTIKDDRRLMAAAVQAVTPDELAKALELIAERLKS